MSTFKDIDSAALQTMQADPQVRVIDVRTDAEVARGKIAGAVHIPLNTLPARLPELDSETPIVIYCQSGGRSAQASAFLAARGFDKVFNLQGGITAWVRAGLPVEVPSA